MRLKWAVLFKNHGIVALSLGVLREEGGREGSDGQLEGVKERRGDGEMEGGV